MWKITNKENTKILKKFESKIIYSFFHLLLNAKSVMNKTSYEDKMGKDIWQSISYYQQLPPESKKIVDNYFKIKKKDEYFYNLFKEIIIKYSRQEIKRIIQLYFRQNSKFSVFENANLIHSIDLGGEHIPNLREVVIPIEIKTIFTEFFFDRFFNLKIIWKLIHGIPVTKLTMHDNFYEENSQISICPFCDISLTVSKHSYEWEHFLPKSKFPLLSMNPYNLFPACKPCNNGKGTKVGSKVFSPATFQVGDWITFKLRVDGIEVQNTRGIKEVSNFLDLFKVNARYNEKRVYNNLKRFIDTRSQSLRDVKMAKEIEKYLTVEHKHTPMSLAKRSIVKSYLKYIKKS
ncbi:hypothetical protein COM77_23305 [Bacillus cereus]|uniref:HNH endonuclease n=1 Tax=Bacillus cereus TaxID=1396 RepID=UPI000BECB949|nr:hypothetical protein [Bacillus cereus]MDA1935454.1 hypothetical protein [Bacillus cereus]MDA1941359.1 hypothetical protein [Bacillus cereus]PEB33851.1 hypothetical protein COM77_23305 [Bacillus cereus]